MTDNADPIPPVEEPAQESGRDLGHYRFVISPEDWDEFVRLVEGPYWGDDASLRDLLNSPTVFDKT